MSLRVLIAPDSFKSTLGAAQAAAALAAGWREVRPADELRMLPLADGGEGTVDALAAATPDSVRHEATVGGPAGPPITVPWLELPDGTAVVELATCCGLPLLPTPDPLRASTRALGELISHVLGFGVPRLLVGLGGSASTDGGVGALQALGARFTAVDGRELEAGGAALRDLAAVDASGLPARPPGGVELLTDVTNPLTGPSGAAAVFGPQKGATPADVAVLAAGLDRLRAVVGTPDGPGCGAAGGTSYGLAAVWGARIVPGAEHLLAATGFAPALADRDLLITGEGSFDAQSLGGKLVGTALADAARSGVPAVVIAGRVVRAEVGDVDAVSLTELAGSGAAALAEPARWLVAAGRALASRSSAGRPG